MFMLESPILNMFHNPGGHCYREGATPKAKILTPENLHLAASPLLLPSFSETPVMSETGAQPLPPANSTSGPAKVPVVASVTASSFQSTTE